MTPTYTTSSVAAIAAVRCPSTARSSSVAATAGTVGAIALPMWVSIWKPGNRLVRKYVRVTSTTAVAAGMPSASPCRPWVASSGIGIARNVATPMSVSAAIGRVSPRARKYADQSKPMWLNAAISPNACIKPTAGRQRSLRT